MQQTLELVIKTKKIAVEFDKRFEGKEESKNNDYQFYENLSIKSIVEFIQNKKLESVLIHNNCRSYSRFRDVVFELSDKSGLGWIQRGADTFELQAGKVNPKL